MNQTTRTTETQDDHERDSYRGRWSVDQRTWPLIGILAMLLVVTALMVGAITWVGSVRDDRQADLIKDLSEKYGVTVELPDTRLSVPAVWTIDGVERNCIYDNDTITLKCLDGAGAYTETGNAG